MLSRLKKFFTSPYQPLNKMLIDAKQFGLNYTTLDNYCSEIMIAPVLKSNAYGHGLLLIAGLIKHQKPPFICVDSLPEANTLAKFGTHVPILIMGSIAPQSLRTPLRYHLTIISKASLEQLIDFQPKAQVHLFIDTGMNREGVKLEELEDVLALLAKSRLNLVGVMTHLAIAAHPENPLTKEQLKQFKKAKEQILGAGFQPEWFHIGGSDSLFWLKSDIANVVRTGRVMYGVDAQKFVKLRPIMRYESTIVQLKQIKKGESVGYSATFVADKDMTIAVLPTGYNDGVNRRLSNKGIVLVKGVSCPIVGLVSMNMTVIDVTDVIKVEVGDSVLIFSSDPKDINSIGHSEQIIGTNPSDLLVGMHPSIRREIVW